MTTYYKATRENGTDFNTGTIDYAAALGTGVPVTHPGGGTSLTDAADYLSVSTSPSDCTGFRWPCRLFVVEPVDPWTPHASDLPNKRACRSLLVIEERPAHEAFGPNGEAVVAVIDRASRLTLGEVERLAAAWDAAWDAARGAAWGAAWDAARDAAWDAARDAAWGAAWDAARDAARDAAWDAARDAARAAVWGAARPAAWGAVAHCVRDLITPEQFELLAGPWNTVIGASS